MTDIATPLWRHSKIVTDDVEQARARVAEEFCEHGLHPAGSTKPFHLQFNAVSYGNVTLTFLDYGTTVNIAPKAFEDFYLVLIPLNGRAEVCTGGNHVLVEPGTAAVPDPDGPTAMRWYAGTGQLVVRVGRQGLERRLRAAVGHELDRPLRFAPAMDLRAGTIRSWRDSVSLLQHDADREVRALDHPALVGHLEALIETQLLYGQANNYLADLHQDSPAPPALVRRAVAFIEDHAWEPLTVPDIAGAVGVGVRVLQTAFRAHLGTTPSARLREVRMSGAHEALAAGDPSTTTVAEVAGAWGIWHLGRFSVEYRRRWGESPSQTLRR